ncbi:MAG: hypothetical protein AB8C84_13225 [Oligoflexales bacterium]
MNDQRLLFLYLFVLVLLPGLPLAATPLPQKGKFPSQGVTQAGSLIVPEGCPQAVLSSVGGPGFARGKMFWHLTPVAKNAGRQYKYRLHRIDVEKLKAEPVLSFPFRESFSVIPHGPQVDGITVVSFDGEASCRKGKAEWMSLKIEQTSADIEKPLKGHHSVMVAGSQNGGLLYDLDARRYLDVDPIKAQVRKVWWPLPSYELPLYIDQQRKDTYAWYEKSPQSAVLAHGSREAVYRVPGNMIRVVVDGPRVVFLQLHFLDPHTGTLQFLSQWSGLGVDLSYRIVLPEAYHLEDAMVRLHVASRLALVYGRNRVIQNRWRQAFIVDLRTGEVIGRYKADMDDTVSFAEFDEEGKTVFIDVRDQRMGLQKVLAAFSVLSRTWYKVPLNLH